MRKDLIKSKPKSKAKQSQQPQQEHEFLDAADEFEQQAGKWRAGDASKASRFMKRALDVYDEGLKRYPQSFDLAYNKANLQYHIATDSRLSHHFGTKSTLLETALASHRIVTSINPTTDALYNTAQVLVSLAEVLQEASRSQAAATKIIARDLLEEAVDIFTKCLTAQQQEYEAIQAEIVRAQAEIDNQASWSGSEGGGISVSNNAPASETDVLPTISSQPGEWATIEDPLTPSTLLESCTAQLGALTALLELYDAVDLPAIETHAEAGLETANVTIPALTELLAKNPPPPKSTREEATGPTLSISGPSTPAQDPSSPEDEAWLAAAVFRASIADALYRSARSTATAYVQAVESAFTALPLFAVANKPGTSMIDAQAAYADALIDLASTVSSPPSGEEAVIQTQWTVLSAALGALAALCTLPYSTLLDSSRLATIYVARGDAELFRWRLSQSPDAKPLWKNQGNVVLGNAGVFYRGAAAWAEKGGDGEAKRAAIARAAIVGVLQQDEQGRNGESAKWREVRNEMVQALEQFVEEGVLGVEEARLVEEQVQ